MNVLLVHQGLDAALLEEVIAKIEKKKHTNVTKKAHSAILLSLGDEVLWEEAKEKYAKAVWDKLEDLYLKKSLAN